MKYILEDIVNLVCQLPAIMRYVYYQSYFIALIFFIRELQDIQ